MSKYFLKKVFYNMYSSIDDSHGDDKHVVAQIAGGNTMSQETQPPAEVVARTAEAIRARGVQVTVVGTRAEALQAVQSLIPDGESVMTGSSITLQEIGFEDVLKSGSHRWRNLKADMLAEKDMAKQTVLRRQNTLADTWLGSAHAIAETGELVFASATGSQLASFAFSSPRVIWVAGTQKIVPTLVDALARVRGEVFERENERMKGIGMPGSSIGKLLIFEGEAPYLGRHVHLVLVNERLGF